MSSWPKIIRDPIHDIVPFEDNRCDRLLLDLINTREFQRLRRIKQLGMSELVFPGANHSRFAHSIGVMHNARRFLNRLSKIHKPISENHQTAVLTASLLHDVGHGPFSHTFEKIITEEKHEARTLAIIKDGSTEVNKRLKEYSESFPDTLATFFDEDIEEQQSEVSMPPYLTQIVSSQLDADRFDYLLRDSFTTGTDYGLFDAGWLIEHLYLDGEKNRLFLSHKGLMAAEAYVFARSRMYRTVYFHKTTRAAEVMLRLVFKRYKQLITNSSKRNLKKIVPNAPPVVVSAFSGQLSLQDFLNLDDYTISEFLKCCNKADDYLLKTLGSGLMSRKLFKSVEASEFDNTEVNNFATEATTLLAKEKLDPDYSLVADTPGDTPYKQYDPDDDKPATQIYVKSTVGKIVELSEQSPAVKALTKKYKLLRYYFPSSLRGKIEEIARKTINKGS